MIPDDICWSSERKRGEKEGGAVKTFKKKKKVGYQCDKQALQKAFTMVPITIWTSFKRLMMQHVFGTDVIPKKINKIKLIVMKMNR